MRPEPRDGRWLAEPAFGVYVHIPFCAHRCHYCDFNTYEGLDDLHDAYVDALVADVSRASCEWPQATSVFFGGGTPTLLPAASLVRILAAVRARIGLAPGAEVTAEVNPETVDAAKLDALLEGGFNRFSIGVQSLEPRVLSALGRTHSASGALQAVAAARSAGADDINADLIYGSPWESDADWERSLDGVIAAGPDHISAYALTIEQGTPLHTLIATGRAPDVDPDVQAHRHDVAEQRLGAAGYDRYEVSNWARPYRASRHNVLYWSAGDYVAFGAGAHGHTGGRRYWNLRLPRDYVSAVEQGRSAEAGSEVLGSGERAGEALILGLRLTSGIDPCAFAARFGQGALQARRAVIDDLAAADLLESSPRALALAPAATMVANDVLCRLL